MARYHADVAIVGAGIVGLAHALAAAKRGKKVVIFERTQPQVGASVRNFGLVWPIGQPEGQLYERALRGRAIWLEVLQRTHSWYRESGSVQVAYHADEAAVLEEFIATRPDTRAHGVKLLTAAEVTHYSHAVKTEGLQAALFSPTEVNVDPRQAIRATPRYLEERYGAQVCFNTPVNAITMPYIEARGDQWEVEQVFVCSGPDFETLYPEIFAASGITRCKLQMLRTVPQANGWELGPALSAGLTLLHYKSYAHCTTLEAVRTRVAETMPFYVEHGIHVLLSQTSLGELTIGDHHTYGLTIEPFDRDDINRAILDYLHTFAVAPNFTIAERWHGVYAPLPGKTEFIAHPEPNVTIVNGLGGMGMTLSFGLAEEVIGQAY